MVLFWDSLCRATVALRTEDEFHGCTLSMYETVLDKARQGRLCATQLAKLCLEEVASFIIHDQKGFQF